MALALDTFKTITKVIPTNPVGIYTAPVGYAGVVLLAQCSNIGSQTQKITFSHERTTAGLAVTTELLKDFPIEANDSASLLVGKLVLESNDTIIISGTNGTDLKFLGSILETLK